MVVYRRRRYSWILSSVLEKNSACTLSASSTPLLPGRRLVRALHCCCCRLWPALFIRSTLRDESLPYRIHQEREGSTGNPLRPANVLRDSQSQMRGDLVRCCNVRQSAGVHGTASARLGIAGNALRRCSILVHRAIAPSWVCFERGLFTANPAYLGLLLCPSSPSSWLWGMENGEGSQRSSLQPSLPRSAWFVCHSSSAVCTTRFVWPLGARVRHHPGLLEDRTG